MIQSRPHTAVFNDTPGYSAQVIAGGIAASVHYESCPLRAYTAALLEWLDVEWKLRFVGEAHVAQTQASKQKPAISSTKDHPQQRPLFEADTTTRARREHPCSNDEKEAGVGRGRRQATSAPRPPSVIRGAN